MIKPVIQRLPHFPTSRIGKARDSPKGQPIDQILERFKLNIFHGHVNREQKQFFHTTGQAGRQAGRAGRAGRAGLAV